MYENQQKAQYIFESAMTAVVAIALEFQDQGVDVLVWKQDCLISLFQNI